MRRSTLKALALVVGASTSALGARDAEACGGQFTPVSATVSTVSAHRMIFSISPTATTLYDEIKWSGSPASFAWILPIQGTVTVGLSADILFATLDSLTASKVDQPFPTCAFRGGSGGTSGTGAGSGGTKGSGGGGVMVITQQQVGPYETVQLASSDGSALTSWLTANGYTISAADKPVIKAYVAAGMNFLAMKLVPGAGISAMQPVRVTSAGASPVLPLHMVSVGTGATTTITLWVVADGRWQPQNFPFFTISDSELTWDWTTFTSDYGAVLASKEAASGGTGWLLESSLELSQTTLSNDLIAAVTYDGDAGGGYLPPPPPVDAGPDASFDAGAGGDMVAAADADLAVLFAGIKRPNARITRLSTNIAHSALANDLTLEAPTNQHEITNILVPDKQAGPGCMYYPDGGLVPPEAGAEDARAGTGGTDGKGSGGTAGKGSGGTAGKGGGTAGQGGTTGTSAIGGTRGSGSQADAGPGDTPSSSGGCSTTASHDPFLDFGVGGLFAMLGFRALRSFRRPRRHRK
jgi:Uncharacterized protein conserved in bacteria (DUF2330)